MKAIIMVALLACMLAPALVLAQGGQAPAQGNLNSITSVNVRGATVEIVGTKKPNFTTFTMTDPPRLVIDISEAVFSGVKEEITVGNGTINAIRTASYGSDDSAIARVLIGYEREVETDIQATGNSLVVSVAGGGGTAVAERSGAAAGPAPAAAGPAPAAAGTAPAAAATAPGGTANEAAVAAQTDRQQQEKAAAQSVASAQVDRQQQEKAAAQSVASAQVDRQQQEKAAAQSAASAQETEQQRLQQERTQKEAAVAEKQRQQAEEKARREEAAQAAADARKRQQEEARAAAEEKKRLAAEERESQRVEAREARIAQAETSRRAAPEQGDGVVVSSRRKTMTLVGFRQESTASRVFVRTNAPVRYTVTEGNKEVVLELENTRIEETNNTLPLDTSFFDTAVASVGASAGPSRTVRVAIKLKEQVSYQARQEGNEVSIEFQRPARR
jgi:hypothetical protein